MVCSDAWASADAVSHAPYQVPSTKDELGLVLLPPAGVELVGVELVTEGLLQEEISQTTRLEAINFAAVA